MATKIASENGMEDTMRSGLRIALLTLVGLCVSIGASNAQNWPSKPITWVVPFGAGGGADVVSRIISAALGEELKANFVVENKPGASSTIGTRAIATAEPDGHTVGLLTDVHPVNVATGQTVPYDAFQDLAYISQLITVPMVLYGSPQRSLKSLKEVIEYGKANQGKLTAASIGPATPHHLTMQWLASMAGIRMTIVPYRSIPNGLQALVTGEADLMFVGAAAGQDLISTGKILQLGVATKQRLSRAPDMPTLIEQGFPGFEMISFYGLVAPKKTPAAIIDKMHQGLVTMSGNAAVRQKVEAAGATLTITKPAEFEQLMRDSMVKFQRIADAAKTESKP
jgi:tripartite-type tricarboxylate transporter receptor subunit TctC